MAGVRPDMTDILSSEPDTGAGGQRPDAGRVLTPHASLKRLVILVNPLSGGVGPRAVAEVEAILTDYEVESQVVLLQGGGFDQAIADAFAATPDVIFVLAGDGTARSVAAKARPDGPMMPMELMALKPDSVSAISGISGLETARSGLESAITFSRLSRTKGMDENSTSNSSGTRPPMTSCCAGALPL